MQLEIYVLLSAEINHFFFYCFFEIKWTISFHMQYLYDSAQQTEL